MLRTDTAIRAARPRSKTVRMFDGDGARLRRRAVFHGHAWMMEDTHPEEFARLAPLLPRISPQQRKLIETIVNIQIVWEREVDRRFPRFRAGGRPLTKDGDCRGGTSFETYLAGELKTCSVRTLRQYVRHIREIQRKGGNLALEVAENMARAYTFPPAGCARHRGPRAGRPHRKRAGHHSRRRTGMNASF